MVAVASMLEVHGPGLAEEGGIDAGELAPSQAQSELPRVGDAEGPAAGTLLW